MTNDLSSPRLRNAAGVTTRFNLSIECTLHSRKRRQCIFNSFLNFLCKRVGHPTLCKPFSVGVHKTWAILHI